MVFAGFLSDNKNWNPIPPEIHRPPVQTCVFTSDAAGFAKTAANLGGIGCASVGINGEGKIVFANRIFWNVEILATKVDDKGSSFGSKTTTLEF